MRLPGFVSWAFAATLSALVSGAVSGQDYPNKPIRLVTTEVGGAVDFVARILAQGLAGRLGQQLIVENRGGVQSIPADIVAKARNDGYSLLVSSGAMWIGPLMGQAPYNALKDFAPIAMTNRSVLLLTMHPSVPVRSVGELIAHVKARPGELSYASAGTGAASHLAGELFKAMAGVNIVRISYKGSGAATADLLSGRVQMAFFSATSVIPHVKSGKLLALAVTSAEPSVLFPGLPTIAASGVPGYESAQMYGVFAPAGTPSSVIARLNREIVQVIGQADAKEKLLGVGSEPVGSTPQELVFKMKSEIERLGKVIKDAGIAL